MNNCITIYNMNNQALTVDVVRYFRMNGNRYAIVTLRERDEQGYVKLYVVKIFEENGTLASMNVVDETEWAVVKEKIKEIIKNVKEEHPVSVEDLDHNKLQGIKLGDNRVFKLLDNLVVMLSANKNFVDDQVVVETDQVETEEIQSTPVEENINDITGKENIEEEPIVEGIDYKKLYFQEVAKNKKLLEKLDMIKTLIG